MLVTLYKIGGVHFRLLGTNVFHVKPKNERFTYASSCCRQNLKYENFTSSFGRLRHNIAPKSVLHVQHDYFSSFNQSNYWFVALSLTLPSSNLKLPSNSKSAGWYDNTNSSWTATHFEVYCYFYFRKRVSSTVRPSRCYSLAKRTINASVRIVSFHFLFSSKFVSYWSMVLCYYNIPVQWWLSFKECSTLNVSVLTRDKILFAHVAIVEMKS